MERSQILDMMGTLKLFGMRSAYDETMASGIKRQHEPPRIVGDLLQSEIAEKQARTVKYQIAVAKLPLARDINDFDFTDTPVNEGLVRQLATGAFLANAGAAHLIQQRDLSAEKLAGWLREQTRETLGHMAEKARALAKPDAAERVGRVCADVAGLSALMQAPKEIQP